MQLSEYSVVVNCKFQKVYFKFTKMQLDFMNLSQLNEIVTVSVTCFGEYFKKFLTVYQHTVLGIQNFLFITQHKSRNPYRILRFFFCKIIRIKFIIPLLC